MLTQLKKAAGTGGSVVVDQCQVCGSSKLESILFLGYLPPVNGMPKMGQKPIEQPSYPAELLICADCRLAQLGLIVDPAILFPPEYPYTSGTTKILRENFAELYQESKSLLSLKTDQLIVDIGSNDGTLLSNYKQAGHPVLGIEPTLMADLANQRGIRSIMSFFDEEVASRARREYGLATIVTATNVFAHIENVHSITRGILTLLADGGVFVSESHYFPSLLDTLQYDTIYHEHLRYYSLTSLSHLFRSHGLEIIHAKKIQTHGGSIRVYAARQGKMKIHSTVGEILKDEQRINAQSLKSFKEAVVLSKLKLYQLLVGIKEKKNRIYAIGAPSRASTLVNYVGLDDGLIDAVLEIQGSYKIDKYMPGTLIPVKDETLLFQDQPEYALLLSWHIADELIPKLKSKGYKGKFIVPLPEPRIVA